MGLPTTLLTQEELAKLPALISHRAAHKYDKERQRDKHRTKCPAPTMSYLDSQTRHYHYARAQHMCWNWNDPTNEDGNRFPLPDQESVRQDAHAGLQVNVGEPNSYWDCYVDEDQWQVFQDLLMDCNGNLTRNDESEGNLFRHVIKARDLKLPLPL